MANPDFKKIVIKDAHLQWPKLDQTYRYNNIEKRSEPCPVTANGAAWTCGILMSSEEAKVLWGELQAHYKECQSRSSKLPKFSTVFGMKKHDNGTVTFTAKRNGTTRDGQKNEAPNVLAGDLTPLPDRRLWSGSIANMKLSAHPVTSPQGEGGISLKLDTIQVTKAVYGSDFADNDFTPVAMETQHLDVETNADQEDEFGLPPVRTNAQPVAVSDVFDDEIPFN